MNFPTPRIIQEREQPFLSRMAKVTDAGEGFPSFGLLRAEWLFPRNDAKLVVSPDNLNTFTPAVIARRVSAVAIHCTNIFVRQSLTCIFYCECSNIELIKCNFFNVGRVY